MSEIEKQSDEEILKEKGDEFKNQIKEVVEKLNNTSITTIVFIEQLIEKNWDIKKINDHKLLEDINSLKNDIKNYKNNRESINQYLQNFNGDINLYDHEDISSIIKRYFDINFIINRPNIDDIILNLKKIENDGNIKTLIEKIEKIKKIDINNKYIEAVSSLFDFSVFLEKFTEPNYLGNPDIFYIGLLIRNNSKKWEEYSIKYSSELSTLRDNFYEAEKELLLLKSEIEKIGEKFAFSELNYDHNNCLNYIKKLSLHLRICIEVIISLFIIANREKLKKEEFSDVNSATQVIDMLIKREINMKLNMYEYKSEYSLSLEKIASITKEYELDWSNKETIIDIKNYHSILSNNLHHQNIFNKNRVDINKDSIYKYYEEELRQIEKIYLDLLDIYKFIKSFANYYGYYEKDECLFCVKDFRILIWVPKKIFN